MPFPTTVAPSGIAVECCACLQDRKCASCYCDGFVCEDCLEKHLPLCFWAKAGRSKHWGKPGEKEKNMRKLRPVF